MNGGMHRNSYAASVGLSIVFNGVPVRVNVVPKIDYRKEDTYQAIFLGSTN